MRCVVAQLFLIVALLFGGVDASTLASPADDHHGIELIDQEHHALDVQTDHTDKDGSEAPMHADHHHVHAALAPSKVIVDYGVFVNPSLGFSLTTNSMISRATAPPTQPPSA